MIVKSVIKSAAVQSKETGGTFDTLLLLFLPQTVIAESRRRLSLGSVGECRGKLQLAFLSQLLVSGRR